MIGQEDLVLPVQAQLGAIVAVRSEREIELVVAQVAAVADDVPLRERLHVRDVHVSGLRVEGKRNRVAGRISREQVVGVAVEHLCESGDAQALAPEGHATVTHERTAVDVEGPIPVCMIPSVPDTPPVNDRTRPSS